MPLLIAGCVLVLIGLLAFGLTFLITVHPDSARDLKWLRLASIAWSATVALLTSGLAILRSRQPDAHLFRSPWPAAAGFGLAGLLFVLLVFGAIV